MLYLIPKVKQLTELGDILQTKAIFYQDCDVDHRIAKALSFLPFDEKGVPVSIAMTGESGEGYELTVANSGITVIADGEAGAFYAVQTLRQIFEHDEIPCVYIKDAPEFAYRGFYHDVTRGKVPTVDTIKKLIDDMAYYKMNSLQLYVEHTFEFKETKNLTAATGAFSPAEMRELDAYCADRFIDFIPSLATFGHMYEILNQPEFKHLRVHKDELSNPNFWKLRMRHHTIDPMMDESIDVVKSLIDQFYPHFSTDNFNICGDETFDLKLYEEQGMDTGKMYVDFVKLIIAHLKSKNKKIMMWADILLKHPEVIGEIPEDTIFLNWYYNPEPPEEKIKYVQDIGRTQIVCPGTTTWSRLVENVAVEEANISKLALYGKRYGAIGMLNTNWGDYANPCSLELGMYGLVLGAAKSWAPETEIDDEFYAAVNTLLYHNVNGIKYLKAISEMHSYFNWNKFTSRYFNDQPDAMPIEPENIPVVQKAYAELCPLLQQENRSEYIDEMLLAAEGLCLLAELSAKFVGGDIQPTVNAASWLERYSAKWLQKNKPSELRYIQKMITECDAL